MPASVHGVPSVAIRIVLARRAVAEEDVVVADVPAIGFLVDFVEAVQEGFAVVEFFLADFFAAWGAFLAELAAFETFLKGLAAVETFLTGLCKCIAFQR